jgi:hypothetical protein
MTSVIEDIEIIVEADFQHVPPCEHSDHGKRSCIDHHDDGPAKFYLVYPPRDCGCPDLSLFVCERFAHVIRLGKIRLKCDCGVYLPRQDIDGARLIPLDT